MVLRLLREIPPPSHKASADAKLRRDKPARQERQGAKVIGQMRKIVTGVVTWIFLVGVVGLPYWIVLIPLHDMLLGHELRGQLAHSPALWLTFGSLGAGHFWKAFRSGYDVMPEDQLKQRVRWDVYLLVLRAGAMFVMAAHGLYFILVPLNQQGLTYGSKPGAKIGRVSLRVTKTESPSEGTSHLAEG
jgi:hypothetical protein